MLLSIFYSFPFLVARVAYENRKLFLITTGTIAVVEEKSSFPHRIEIILTSQGGRKLFTFSFRYVCEYSAVTCPIAPLPVVKKR